MRKVENFEVETVRDQLQRNRVHLVYGHGRFVDSHRVEVSSAANCSPGAVQLPDGTCSTLVAPATTVLSADNFLIATGTRPAHNPLFDFTQPNIFDSDQVLKNRDYQIPRELVVVGTGVIAMEVCREEVVQISFTSHQYYSNMLCLFFGFSMHPCLPTCPALV